MGNHKVIRNAAFFLFHRIDETSMIYLPSYLPVDRPYVAVCRSPPPNKNE